MRNIIAALAAGFLLPVLALAQTFSVPVPPQAVTGPVNVPAQTVQATMTSSATTESISINAPGCTVSQTSPTAFSVTACTVSTGPTGKAALLAYITGLKGQTKHILIGQHASYWDATPFDYQQLVQLQTGKSPALMSFSIGGSDMEQTWLADVQAWQAKGGLAMVSWWPLDPQTGASDNNRIDISQLLPGGSLNAKWVAQVKSVGAQLAQIKTPYFFRPFVEVNGNWFWWAGDSTATTVQLWQYTYQLLTAAWVTNALWVYNVNGGMGNYAGDGSGNGGYYPGDAFVDVISADGYGPTVASDTPMWTTLSAINKPQMYAETGVTTANPMPAPWSSSNSTLLQTIKSINPNLIAVLWFCQNWALPEQQNDGPVMTDPAVLTLSDLPQLH